MSFVKSKNKTGRLISLLTIFSIINSTAFAFIASCICGAVCLVSGEASHEGLTPKSCCMRIASQVDIDDDKQTNRSSHCHKPDVPVTPSNFPESNTYQVVSIDNMTWCKCNHQSSQVSDQVVVCSNRLVNELKFNAPLSIPTTCSIDKILEISAKHYFDDYSLHSDHTCPSVYQICTLLN